MATSSMIKVDLFHILNLCYWIYSYRHTCWSYILTYVECLQYLQHLNLAVCGYISYTYTLNAMKYVHNIQKLFQKEATRTPPGAPGHQQSCSKPQGRWAQPFAPRWALLHPWATIKDRSIVQVTSGISGNFVWQGWGWYITTYHNLILGNWICYNHVPISKSFYDSCRFLIHWVFCQIARGKARRLTLLKWKDSHCLTQVFCWKSDC